MFYKIFAQIKLTDTKNTRMQLQTCRYEKRMLMEFCIAQFFFLQRISCADNFASSPLGVHVHFIYKTQSNQ